MVNSQVVQEIINALKLDVRVENIPNPIPVINVGIKASKPPNIITAVRSTTGGSTVFTTSTTQDTYILSLQVSLIKDANCDVADGVASISATINGVSRLLNQLPILTFTAQNINSDLVFKNPVKVDRGAALALDGLTFSVGKLIRTVSITYVLDEVN